MRRCLLGIYADHTDPTRREESLRPFSGSAARASCEGRLRLRRLAPRTSAGQHRHCARGSRNGCVSCDLPNRCRTDTCQSPIHVARPSRLLAFRGAFVATALLAAAIMADCRFSATARVAAIAVAIVLGGYAAAIQCGGREW